MDPSPFSLYELLIMRKGKEHESWDRLSFQIAHDAAWVGAKGTKIEQFHKFLMHEVGTGGLKAKDIKDLKRNFTKVVKRKDGGKLDGDSKTILRKDGKA